MPFVIISPLLVFVGEGTPDILTPDTLLLMSVLVSYASGHHAS